MLSKTAMMLLQGPASRRLLTTAANSRPSFVQPTQMAQFATRFIKPSSASVVHIDAVKRKTKATSSQSIGAFTIDFRLASHVKVPCTQDTSLRTISDALLSSAENNIEKVQFFTLTGSKLPLSEIVKNHRSYPILVQINDDRVFALNFTEEM